MTVFNSHFTAITGSDLFSKEMKAGKATRVSRVEPNEVAEALIEIAFRHSEVIREDLELRG